MPEVPRSMSGLIDEAKKLRAELRQAEKAKRASDKYVTACKWRYGQALAVIHAEAKKKGKGEWKRPWPKLAKTASGPTKLSRSDSALGLRKRRESVRCCRALKLIRKRAKGSDVDDADNRGSSTPQWLFDRCNQLAIEACGEPITLDVAAAEWNHKCERYYTEQDDGRTKPWDAKAVFCNSPYTPDFIESFVRKAIAVVQRGTTTVMLIPSWNYPYMDLCEQHGKIHRVCGPVSFQRPDGTAVALNRGHGTSPLVVVVFGPTIQPGFGTPIRKDQSEESKALVEGVQSVMAGVPKGGITARAILGDGDNRRENDAYYTPLEAITALLSVRDSRA